MTQRISIVLTFALLFSLSACSGGSPEGTYAIDIASVTKAMDEEIAKLPEQKQAMAKMMMGMLKSMKLTLTLEKGGTSTMNSEVTFGKETKKDSDKGTWKLEGKKITLVGKKKSLTCDLKGNEIVCAKGKGMPFPLILKKQ